MSANETQESPVRLPHCYKYVLMRHVHIFGLGVCGTIIISGFHNTREKKWAQSMYMSDVENVCNRFILKIADK